MTRHFLDLSDFSGSELRAILRTGEEIKARRRTPAAVGDRLLEGKVVATGPGRTDDNGKRIPLDVSEGDVVIFSKYGGTEVKYDGKEYLLLAARDLLAVVTK